MKAYKNYPFKRIILDDVSYPIDLEYDPVSTLRKAQIEFVDRIDELIVQTIVAEAKKQGITDLYLIDKNFVIEAIKEKLEKEKNYG